MKGTTLKTSTGDSVKRLFKQLVQSRLRRSLTRTFLIAALFAAFAASADDVPDVVVYRKVNATTDGPLAVNTFEVFSPNKIVARQDSSPPEFRASFTYSGRDWRIDAEPEKQGRIPTDPSLFQHVVLLHRTVPAILTITFEKVEAAADADPVTLAKILRYNREADAKFRVLNESIRRIGGVDGAQTEYVQLRKNQLMRIRHWTTHYNGVAYQLQLIVPYDHPELLDLGGVSGFPVILSFSDPTRTRPLILDSEIPRTYESRYGYHVNLGEGEWIPSAQDPYITAAEYVAYTRNQGGIAVVPLSTFGQRFDSASLLSAVTWLGDLPTKHMQGKPKHILEGKLDGVTFETLVGNEEEMIRMRAKAVCSEDHAYLAVAWVNTNSPLGPDVLNNWLSKITFSPETAHSPANEKDLGGLRERTREAMGLCVLGDECYDKGNFDLSANALRSGMNCRFLPELLQSYTKAQFARRHPEEIVNFINARGAVALGRGWVVLELARAESSCGQAGKAASHYIQCLSSGGYTAGDFPPDYFEDFILCLAKVNRTAWASDRLKQRIKVDPSPLWPKMLADLNEGRLASPTVIATAGSPASTPTANVPRPVVLTVVETPRTGTPELKNITWNEHMPSAQLDQKMVFEGDSVRGYKVVKIHEKSVELTTPEGAPLTLPLKPS